MSDNVELDAGSGGDSVRAEDKSGVKTQVVIIDIGGSSTESLLSSANPMPISDASGSLTVDGTVAATQSGTWTVTGAGGSFPVTDSSGSLTVDAPVGTPVFVRLSDGSSAITTLPVSLASVPSHAVTNAGTFVVQIDGTALTRLTDIETNTDSGAVVGNGAAATAQRVTLANDSTGIVSLTTSTASIGKLAANSGVDIGDVDVTSVPADPFGANADAASATGSISAKLRFIASTGIPITGTVTVGSHAVTNAGTFVVQVDGSALTALQLIDNIVTVDDAAFTAASGSGVPMMGFVTSDSVDSGDVGAVAMLANRQLKTTIYDSSGVEVTSFGGAGTQYTEDAAAAANPVGTAMIVVREDGRAGSLTTTDGDNVALRGNNFGELYVKHTDTIAATQSGTWNVGTVTTVTSIGTSVVPGTGATHLGKAEDAAHSSGDTGVFVLAVRSDTAAATGQTDGDYTALVTDSSGRLHVNVGNTVTVGSHAVTNAGTFAVQVDGSALTALQLIDDTVFADDAAFTAATSKGIPMMGFVTADSVDSGDVGAVGMLTNRQLKVTLYDSSGVELAVGGGTQYTEDAAAAANPVGNALNLVRADSLAGVTSDDGDNVAARGTDKGELYVKHADTIAATQSGTWNVGTVTTVTAIGTSVTPGTSAAHLGKAEDAAHSSGDTGVFVLAVRSDTAAATGQTDGDYTALVTDSSGRLHVNVGNTVTVGSHAVTNAGTFAVQVDGSALTALQLIDDVVYVDDADFVDDTSKFALTGGVYQSAPQTVTDGDVAPFLIDVNGRMQVGTHAVTQSGTWNVGTVTTVTTVSTVTNVATIGTSVVPGTGATHLGKAEDAQHASGDTGVYVLAVRSDTAAATGTTDGDYTSLVTDSTGRLWCNVSNTVTVASHAVTNAGTFAVQVDGNALTALQLIDDPVVQDDAAFTPGTTKVMMAGFEADDASTDSVDEGDGGAARMTLSRKIIVNPQPHTTGGLSTFRSLDLDETEEDIKTSAGQIYAYYIYNNAASTRFIKVYNATAANVTVGSTTPVWTIPVPAGSAANLAFEHGVVFDTAISAAATTAVADADTGAPSANDVVIMVWYL